ncbi:MAG: DMT family transporter [Oscillospiraceae bacterium]|nr:DMT family transporter [Oscillospiraceae bacterium]
MEKNRDFRSLALLIVSMLIFGTNGILVNRISISSAEIVFFRTIFGSLILLAVIALRKGFDLSAVRADMPWNLFAGLALGLNWVLLFEAYRKASVSIATLVYYCGPMLVIALSPLLFREKLTGRKLTAVVLVAVGMVLITGTAGSAGAEGILLASGAAVLYAFIVICSKQVKHMKGMNLAFLEIAVSFFVMLVYLPLSGVSLPVIPGKGDLVWLLIIGIVNTGAAYWMYFTAMQRLPAQTVSLISYLDPLSALVFAALLIPGERLTAVQAVGAVLILGGAVYAELKH